MGAGATITVKCEPCGMEVTVPNDAVGEMYANRLRPKAQPHGWEQLMSRGEWLAKRRHEFEEDVDDGSMCVCGVPADSHGCVEPVGRAVCTCWRQRADGSHARGCALSLDTSPTEP